MGDAFEAEALEVLEVSRTTNLPDRVEDSEVDDAPEFAPSRLAAAGNAARFAWWWLRDLARRLVGRAELHELRGRVEALELERDSYHGALMLAVDEALALQVEKAELHRELRVAYDRLRPRTPAEHEQAVQDTLTLIRTCAARLN